jgi:hypothetical protein
MTDNKGDGFKFVDRRRVDAEGNDRGVDEKNGEANASKASQQKAAQPKGGVAQDNTSGSKVDRAGSPQVDSSSNGAMSIGFAEFVMSFATQALMQLGQMQPPPGVNVPKDLRAAKQTIDIIQMLESKTKGNLDQAETVLLSDILHNLRIAYLNVSQGK